MTYKVIRPLFATSSLATQSEMMDKKVLLIGRNALVLKNLDTALTGEGFHVQTTNRVEQAGSDFDGADFDLVAFGRGVDEPTNVLLRSIFLTQNLHIRFVDGLAPVIPLLVRQIKLASSGNQVYEKRLADFSCQQADNLLVHVNIAAPCQLLVNLYQLDAVHHIQKQTLVDEFVTAGKHTFLINKPPLLKATINFLAAETGEFEFAVLPL